MTSSYTLPQNGGSFYTSTEREVLIDPFVSPPQMQSQLTGELTRYEDLVRRDFRYAHLVAGASKMPMNMIWVSRNQGGDVNDQDLAALRDVAWTEFVKKRFLPSVAEGSSVAEAAASMLEIVRSMNLQRRRFQIMGLHEQVEASELQLVIHLCQAGLLHTGDYRVTANRFRRHDKFFEAFALAVGAFVCSSAPFTMGVATTQLNRSLQFEYKKQTTALFVYVLQENRSLVNQTGFGFDEDYVARIARFIIVSQDDSTTAGQLPPPKDEGGSSKTETFIRGALESVQRQADRVERLAAQMDRDADRGNGGRGRGRDSGVDEGKVSDMIRRALAEQLPREKAGARDLNAIRDELERGLGDRLERSLAAKYDAIIANIHGSNARNIESIKHDNERIVRGYGEAVARIETAVNDINRDTTRNIGIIKNEIELTKQNYSQLIQAELGEIVKENSRDRLEIQKFNESIQRGIDEHHAQQTQTNDEFKAHINSWLQQFSQQNIQGSAQILPVPDANADLHFMQFQQNIDALGRGLEANNRMLTQTSSQIASIEASNLELNAQFRSVKVLSEGNSMQLGEIHQRIGQLNQRLEAQEARDGSNQLYVRNSDFILHKSEVNLRFESMNTINEKMAELTDRMKYSDEDLQKAEEKLKLLELKLDERVVKQEHDTGDVDAKITQLESRLQTRMNGLMGDINANLNQSINDATARAVETAKSDLEKQISTAKDEVKAATADSVRRLDELKAQAIKESVDHFKNPDTVRELSERIARNEVLRQDMNGRIDVAVGQRLQDLSTEMQEIKTYMHARRSTAPSFNMFSGPADTAAYAAAPP